MAKSAKQAKPALTRKYTSTIIVLSVLSILFTTFFLVLLIQQMFTGYIQGRDQVSLEQWLPAISEHYILHGEDGLQQYLETNTAANFDMLQGEAAKSMELQLGQRLVVTDMQGVIVADSHGLLTNDQTGLDLNNAVSGVILADDKEKGILYILSPLRDGVASLEKDFISGLTFGSSILALFMVVFALTVGLQLGRKVSAPLEQLAVAVHEVAQEKLDRRVYLDSDPELVQLGDDFNIVAQNLERAEAYRQRFTADLSHELRTPLTLVRGQLEGMQAGSIPADNENVTQLLEEVTKLSRLVDEMDNLNQLDNQAISLNVTAFSPSELLENLSPAQMAMQDKGITFNCEISTDIKQITADRGQLLQILNNLLANAMQQVNSGGVITLSIQQPRYLKDQLLFSVADNGPGIAAGDLPHVFERFYRIPSSRNEGGGGLGLATAKGYVEAHNGEIWVESALEEGAAFYFTLPQA